MIAIGAVLAAGCVIGGPPRESSSAGSAMSAGPPGSRTPAPSGATLPSRVSSTRVQLITRHAFYEVSGNTGPVLRAEMDKLGPLDRRGVRRDAYTGWSVKWSYGYQRGGGGCRPGAVRVVVEVTYTLPRWRIPGDVNPRLHDRWTRYIHNLRRHEDGHRDIGVHAGEEVRRRMEGMAMRADCQSLETDADKLGQAVVEKYRQIERAYDRDSDHGATQGARFR